MADLNKKIEELISKEIKESGETKDIQKKQTALLVAINILKQKKELSEVVENENDIELVSKILELFKDLDIN